MPRFLTPLFAAADLAEDARQLVTYRFTRLEQLDDARWMLWLVVVVVASVVLLAVVNYVRESRSLPRGMGVVLGGLRLLAVAGAVLFFLNLQKRTDLQTTAQSQVAVLVDTSQSMSVRDEVRLMGGESVTRSEATSEALLETLVDRPAT